MIIAYITYINIHITSCGNTISQTLPAKNKLDASNLLIACFTWLMGATLKNGSYLRQATTLILGLPKSCCKFDDNYSGRYRHPPAACVEQATAEPVSRTRSCKVGLGRFNPTIPRHQEVHKKKLAPKTSTPATNIVAFYSCKTSTHRSRSDTTEGFRSIDNKKFPMSTNKNKPRSDLRDAKQRAREIRSTYLFRSHNRNVQMNVVSVVVLASPARDPIRSKRHNGQRL
jgi:hypothetical protein